MLSNIVKTVSAFSVPTVIILIIIYGAKKKQPVYDCFTEGARDGIETTFSVIPPLVGLVTAVYGLRASGAFEMLAKFMSPLLSFIGMPSEVLPLALLRPVSGSASLAVASDIFKSFGCDSFAGRCASVMMGSTETTFYTLAVYFGAGGIRDTKYTLKSALSADLCGMLLSVIITKLFFY